MNNEVGTGRKGGVLYSNDSGLITVGTLSHTF